MTRQDLLNYVTTTPYNTNTSIVKNKLNQIITNILQRNNSIEQVDEDNDYLYEITYTDWNYSEVNRHTHFVAGGCSSIATDNIVGRNYDWFYDDTVEFILHCEPTDGRHRSIGVASINGLTAENMTDANINELYDILPFATVDGINDVGVYCNINVVPLDYGKTTDSNPAGADLNQISMVRFVLDYADSVDDAIAKLHTMNIYASAKFNEELHMMLKDNTKTVVIEFINNELKVIDEFVDNKPIMTNFHLYNWDGTNDTLELHPAGLERYDILAAGYDSIVDEDDMLALMKQVNYTQLYDTSMNPYWYSEFNGKTETFGELTKNSQPEDYADIIAYAVAHYIPGTRNGEAWQTLHTSVYNIADRTLTVLSQEGDTEYQFELD